MVRAIKKPTGFRGMKGQPPIHSSGSRRNATSFLGRWAAFSTFSFSLTFRSSTRTGLSQKCEKMLFQQEQKQTSLLAPELLSEPAWIPTVCWAWACSFTEALVHSGLMIIFSCYSDHDDKNNEDVMVVTLPPLFLHPFSCHQASAFLLAVHLPPRLCHSGGTSLLLFDLILKSTTQKRGTLIWLRASSFSAHTGNKSSLQPGPQGPA